MTALDFVGAHPYVVLRYASQGSPAGEDVALMDGIDLRIYPNDPDGDGSPASLADIEGEVRPDGSFVATDLNDGSGAFGWRWVDCRANDIYMLTLRSDREVWQEQADDYEASV